jgi:hypothetical protein
MKRLAGTQDFERIIKKDEVICSGYNFPVYAHRNLIYDEQTTLEHINATGEHP